MLTAARGKAVKKKERSLKYNLQYFQPHLTEYAVTRELLGLTELSGIRM